MIFFLFENNRERNKNMLNIKLNNHWDSVLEEEFQKEYFQKLDDFLTKEYEQKIIYPPQENIFNAFKLTDINNIKVVILGQDPYHEYGQAHGLAFSTPKGNKIPKSLNNIFKELSLEYGYDKPTNGSLIHWAEQGVLLLNTVLTVEEKNANSHKNSGWIEFTDNILIQINQLEQPIVFLLWGNQAQEKESLLNNSKHLILKTTHPSPFSANKGFIGCNHFMKANEYLKQNGLTPIDWKVD